MKVGEKMSEWVIFENLHWRSDGDVYENFEAMIKDRPIDEGRLLYAKLRTSLDESIEVEVYWNHITDMLTVVVDDNAGRVSEVTFPIMTMARTDLVERINQFVETLRSTYVE